MSTLDEKAGATVNSSSQDTERLPHKVSAEELEHAPDSDKLNDHSHAFKGDDSDGKVEWSWRQIIASLSLAMLYVGGQGVLWFVGGSIPFMEKDIGGSTHIAWVPVANAMAISSILPFSGYLQDIFGKRNIALFGSVGLMAGGAIVSSSHTFGQAVAGMAIAGAGGAICEMSALAGTAELVPVRKRGIYLGFLTASVLPFVPYVMYAELLGTYSTWRWGQWIVLIWNGIGATGLLFTYFPQSQLRPHDASWKKVAKEIDYVGGILSIIGLVLLLVALQSGGYTRPWKSAYVLCTFLIGIFTIIAWVIWEWKFAKFPMVPKEVFAGQRITGTAFFIAFIAGINFFSLLQFFPLSYTTLYKPDPVQIGLKGLGPSIALQVGASGVNMLLSVFKGRNKEILIICCIMMTAFGGSLACLTPDNPKTAIALSIGCGFGIGGVLVPAATVAIFVAPDNLIATTSALALSIRVVGGSIGYSIYYNVFVTKLKSALPMDIAKHAIAAGLPLSSAEEFVITLLTAPKNIGSVPGVTPAVLEGAAVGSRWAYAYALKYVWYCSIPFGLLACIACTTLPNTTKYMTNRIAAVNKHIH